MKNRALSAVLLIHLLLSPSCFAAASNQAYSWKVKRVVDGDTIEVEESFLPRELKLFVRVNNVDTPEKGRRAKCDEENNLAQKASKFTAEMIENAQRENQQITFSNIRWDKYGGRVLADVKIGDKVLADELIKNGFAREYHGEKKQSWCLEK